MKGYAPLVKMTNIPLVVGNTSDPVNVSMFRRFTVWYDGTGNGTWRPQASPDNALWVDHGANSEFSGSFTAVLNYGANSMPSTFYTNLYAYGACVLWFRLKCVAYTSGTPTFQITGEYW